MNPSWPGARQMPSPLYHLFFLDAPVIFCQEKQFLLHTLLIHGIILLLFLQDEVMCGGPEMWPTSFSRVCGNGGSVPTVLVARWVHLELKVVAPTGPSGEGKRRRWGTEENLFLFQN